MQVSPRIYFDRNAWPDEYRALQSLHPSDTLIVGFDLQDSARALGEIVTARRRGIPVATFCVYRAPLETLMHNINASIAQTPDPDLRAKQIGAAAAGTLVLEGGKKPRDLAAIPPSVVNVCAFTVRLSDVVLLSTPAELQRLQEIGDKFVRRYALLEAPPTAAKARGDGVVLFAPTLPRTHLGGYEYALAMRRIIPQVISAENPTANINGSIVVMPEWWRGLTARSLAEGGFRVIVPNENGADAFHSGIVTFSPYDLHSLADALERCWAMQHTYARMSTSANGLAAIEADRTAPTRGPRVSVIVRTANRPDFLKRALASIANQKYQNIEVVLVNNGGISVEELAREALRNIQLCYVNLPTAVEVGVALNHGARAASGELIAYLDDDDILYADHLSRCIYMLEASNADLVFTNCVGEYAQVIDGVKQVFAMQVYTDNPYRLDELHASNLATIHSVVHRRSLFTSYGYFDESLPVTEDWELWLRAAAGGARIVHLDRATCEYSWRHDPKNPNTSIARLPVFAEAYDVIVKRYASQTAAQPDTIGRKQFSSYEHQRARAEEVRVDPSKAIAFVMHDLLPTAVPVEGLSDDLE